MINVTEEVLQAEKRIRPYTRQTILEYSRFLSRLGEANVYCKLENLQHTGSFKVRGAMNKLLALTAHERERGVVTASTGNHGMAVAYSLDKLHTPGIIFVPKNTTASKVKEIERMGAVVRYYGEDTVHTEVHARQYAAQTDAMYVPPYNDPQVIGGQGTIGLELARQLDQIDVVFVSLGGGGLISGIAGYLKNIRPEVQVIGCSPENSQVMIQSVNVGRILDLPSLPTLSDGTAGGIEAGSITFELCRDLVDDYITVTEDEIKESLLLFIQNHHILIEGAAAVAIASYLKIHERFTGKNVVIIICGANIDLETLKKILCTWEP
jgi:threonine dehydratase